MNFEEACAYQQRRRNFAPARYNYSSQWLRTRAAHHYAGQSFAAFFQRHSQGHSSSGNLNKTSKRDLKKFE